MMSQNSKDAAATGGEPNEKAGPNQTESVDLDDLLQEAMEADPEEDPKALLKLVQALAAEDPLTQERYVQKVKDAKRMGKTALRQAIKEAARVQRLANQETQPEEGLASDGLPRIDVGDRQLRRITGRTWNALHRANRPDPFIFRFGGLATRIELDDTGQPVTSVVRNDDMRHILARVANFVDGATPELPPSHVVRDVLATPSMPLPIITGIVGAPVFAPDGTLETEPGYHAQAKIYYHPANGFELPEVPQSPTKEDVEAAKALVFDDLLVDFPLMDDPDRSHAVALMLLPFLRGMIDGPTPLHLISKPAPGTGATLLADLLLYPATGQPVPAMVEGTNENEWRKRLTATLMQGGQALLIDNLRTRLESSSLASAITAPLWTDRIITTSTVARVQIRCAWIATGNNPSLSNEIARRSVLIHMDAGMPRPWLRHGFKHPKIRKWAKANRAQLVWACLTIVQTWVAAGMPRGQQSLGMFESWVEVIGGILDVAGIPGFLGNLNALYERTDDEGFEWRSFITQWWQKHGGSVVKVSDLYDDFVAVYGTQLPQGSVQGGKTHLGLMLKQSRDQRYRFDLGSKTIEVKLEFAGNTQNANRWKLKATDEG